MSVSMEAMVSGEPPTSWDDVVADDAAVAEDMEEADMVVDLVADV